MEWDKKAITAAIFHYLKERQCAVSEYELLHFLGEQGFFRFLHNTSPKLQLFSKHFIIRHCLYLLQESLPEPWSLTLSALQIQLHVLAANTTARQIGQTDAGIRDYYLDLKHLQTANEASVDQLLQSFWQRFVQSDDIQKALHTLDVKPNTDWSDIVTAYRRLAHTTHPDRGGDQEAFSRVQDAYEILKKHFGQ